MAGARQGAGVRLRALLGSLSFAPGGTGSREQVAEGK